MLRMPNCAARWGSASVLTLASRILGSSWRAACWNCGAIILHGPLPSAATIIGDERVIGAFDKGAGKGAVIVTEKKIRLKDTNEPLCTLVSSTFARGGAARR